VKEVRRRGEAAGYTPFDPSEFDDKPVVHYGVKGMHWGQSKASAKAYVDKMSTTQKAKTVSAVGAAAVATILYSTGTHGVATKTAARLTLKGASVMGGLMVKVGAMVGNAALNTAITVIGTPIHMIIS
jgi:hypothetical protein